MKNTTRDDIFFKNTPRQCHDVWHCQTYEHSFCPRQKSERNPRQRTSVPNRAVKFMKLSGIVKIFLQKLCKKLLPKCTFGNIVCRCFIV